MNKLNQAVNILDKLTDDSGKKLLGVWATQPDIEAGINCVRSVVLEELRALLKTPEAPHTSVRE